MLQPPRPKISWMFVIWRSRDNIWNGNWAAVPGQVRHGAKVVFCAPGSEGERGKVIEKELNDSAGPGEGHFEVCDVLHETDIKQAALPHLRKTKGNIINIASLVGLIGQKYAVPYVATKGAVTAMTKAMAIDESRYGVRVNSISPGNIWTPMWEKLASQTVDPEATIQEGIDAQLLGRMGTPAECAAAALYLASEATFCTGVNLVLSGGAELGYAQKSHRELNPGLED
ncbi:17-beta-hydroxysteroid dehydrogenase 14 isoform X3 [Zootoca vivipara]|uniref:17-beta-hydroxysteroid dehydrogenase 14 isoform X3 n=1 Tax=Zootoca vivipara TaxID=8524 RepID=UPI00293BA02C|nr:17-beta-hydroxysteroid dehydrogenase 14 isoform X3 [Zootoca vivipara]